MSVEVPPENHCKKMITLRPEVVVESPSFWTEQKCSCPPQVSTFGADLWWRTVKFRVAYGCQWLFMVTYGRLWLPS